MSFIENQTEVPAKPFFLSSSCGKIFTIYHYPLASKDRQYDVVIIPPFAEEMNKSRHMFTRLARQLNAIGIGVLLFDLYGTGDSEGDFADSSWSAWEGDIGSAVNWLQQNRASDLIFLTLRSGCLLALNFINRTKPAVKEIIMWQPTINGEQFMTQFLRIRLASAMMEKDQAKETMAEIKQKLTNGESVEVAGYELSSELYQSLNSLRLQTLVNETTPPIYWLELVSSEDKPIPVGSQKVIDQIQQRGNKLISTTAVGEPFWSLQEITMAENLLQATVAHIKDVFANEHARISD